MKIQRRLAHTPIELFSRLGNMGGIICHPLLYSLLLVLTTSSGYHGSDTCHLQAEAFNCWREAYSTLFPCLRNHEVLMS